MDKFNRLPNENETEFIYRVCSNKDEIGSWLDVAELLNENLGYNYTESKYRKDYSSYQRIIDSMGSSLNSDRYIQQLKEQKEGLEKERAKIRTERLEYARMLRESARDDMIIEHIRQAVENIEPLKFPYDARHYGKIGSDWVLAFGDEHYGSEFEIKGLRGEVINKYSPQIFEDRMWHMLDETANIVEKENIDTLHVFSLGDFADGVLRVGQLVKLAYGVVDATVNYMEFISNWLNEMTRFCNVKFYMTDGNHTELRMFNQPKGAFKDENMGKIIRSYLKARLDGNQRFELVENPSGYIYAELAGYKVVGVHGEAKDMEKEIKDLSSIYGLDIDYLFGGHLHHFESKQVGINRGITRVPSVVGVDDFALGLRKVSNPGAILCGFDELRGKSIEYHINLQ